MAEGISELPRVYRHRRRPVQCTCMDVPVLLLTDVAQGVARDAARDAARDVAWDVARDVPWDVARGGARKLDGCWILLPGCWTDVAEMAERSAWVLHVAHFFLAWVR